MFSEVPMKSLKRQFNAASLSLELTRNEVQKDQAVKNQTNQAYSTQKAAHNWYACR